MNEFNAGLLTRFKHLNARPDPINRCAGEHCYRDNVSALEKRADQAFSRIASMTAARLPVIQQLPEVSLIQVRGDDGELAIYTLFRNRAHSNVAFLLGESLRYQPEKDTITLYPGVLASYPNFMFRVGGDQLDAFVAAMANAEGDNDFNDIVERFGIRRTTPDFWRYFHAPTRYLEQHEPIQAGTLDLNRYENL